MFECEKCKKKFKSNFELKRHLNRKTPCTSQKLQCFLCEKIFSSRSSLSRHRKKCKISENSKEINERPLCDHKSDHKNSHFVENKNIEMENVEKLYSCKYCGSKFKHKTHMYRHIRKYCKIAKEKEEIFLEELKEENIHHQNQQHPHAQNIFYINQNEINIHTNDNDNLHSYGNENMDWIKKNFLSIIRQTNNCENLADFIEFGFKNMHFNKNTLENSNIKVGNKKDFFERDIVSIYKDSQWKLEDNRKIVHASTQKFVECLEDSLVEFDNSKNKNIPNIESFMNMIDKFDDMNSKPDKDLKEVTNKLKPKLFMLINNYHKTQDTLK